MDWILLAGAGIVILYNIYQNEVIMAQIDDLNAALDTIDALATSTATAVAKLVEELTTAQSNGDLSGVLEKASAIVTKLQGINFPTAG